MPENLTCSDRIAGVLAIPISRSPRDFVIIPAKYVLDDSAKEEPDQTSTSARSAGVSAKQHVMLVEDNLIIAMDAENFLNKLGFAKVSIYSNVNQALESMAINNFDFAVLDINLGSETSIPVAEKLNAKSIPFVFATGYTDSRIIPEPLSHVPVITKPFTLDNFKVINQLLAG